MNPQYSEEEKKEITERTEKAIALLKDLQLQPACFVGKINIGNDTFVDNVIPYLQDLKYKKEPVKSPLSDEITKNNP